jgi:SPX domain protein involved in polyphosphate accumulation
VVIFSFSSKSVKGYDQKKHGVVVSEEKNMETVQTVEHPTFESVMVALDRVAEQQRETSRQISRLGNRIGELIEHFAASNLLEKFEELGFEFTVISRNYVIKDKRKYLAAIAGATIEGSAGGIRSGKRHLCC